MADMESHLQALKWEQETHFILGVKTKETQELSNPIGGEIKICPKGFTLGIETKVSQIELVPMWHHFGSKFSRS
jgi:hypothetical protein